MYYYFALFHPDEQDPQIFNVSFPDLPGCHTWGKGIQEAMQNAMEALTGYLEVEIDAGCPIPPPSDIKAVRCKGDDLCCQLEIPPHDDAIYLLVPADPRNESFVRVNISLPPRLLAMVDKKAREEGMSRSGFLATAAREYLNHQD